MLLKAEDLRWLKVCEIGAGTGRFVNIALAAGTAHVVAVEPSAAFEVLRENTRHVAERITYLRIPGALLPGDLLLDLVLSIVLHHVPDAAAVAQSAFRGLKAGGRIAIWVYGRENNGAYLTRLTAP